MLLNRAIATFQDIQILFPLRQLHGAGMNVVGNLDGLSTSLHSDCDTEQNNRIVPENQLGLYSIDLPR